MEKPLCYVFLSLFVFLFMCSPVFCSPSIHPSLPVFLCDFTIRPLPPFIPALTHTLKDVALPSPPPTSLTRATTDHLMPGSRVGAGPKPSGPRDVVASLVSTRFIKLTWRVPAEPHGEDVTYSVYYSLEGTNRHAIYLLYIHYYCIKVWAQ